MAQITRRWTYDPGNAVLTQIEGVDIIDNTPPQQVIGTGTNAALIVGEFENGPFAATTEVTSFTQLKQVFGVFGYTYGNTVGNNPSARKRYADSATLAEFWNGNGAIQLNGKTYARLFIMRVDTSVGSVAFTRQANLLGGSLFRYAVAATGDHLDVSVDGAGAVAATFTGVAATVTGSGAAFGSITAGMTAVLGVDGQANFTVFFQAGDTSIGAAISRINSYAGFTFASNTSGQLTLTGVQAGTGGQVRVVSGTALTDLGLTVATTSGTGNVANLASVSPTEIDTVVYAAVATVHVEQLPSGQLRLYRASATPSTDSVSIAGTSTVTFGFPVGTTDAASTGNGGVIPAGTLVQVPAGNVYLTMQDVLVTSTVVGGAGGAGPYSVKVRPAQDDGTVTGALANTVTQVGSGTPILLDSFAVNNTLPLTAALTESAIDAAYTAAIAGTLNVDDVSQQTNILWAARQSNSVRAQLLANVQAVGDNGGAGVLGRITCVRPPIGTLASAAESGVAQPGVGATSYQRVVYCYPGVTTTVTAIQTVGPAGGTGFSIPGQAVGTATVGSDGFMASICSQLPPEENPGQLTTLTSGATGFEVDSGGGAVNGGSPLVLGDYINFKANGIAAPTFTGGAMQFQSGVTSVLAAEFPSLAPIARRRMADYIQDSLAQGLGSFVKKLMTVGRQAAATLTIRTFMIGLLSPTNANAQRINGFLLDTVTPNVAPAGGVSPTTLGLWRALLLVQTTPSMDDIVLDTTIGDTVTFQQAA